MANRPLAVGFVLVCNVIVLRQVPPHVPGATPAPDIVRLDWSSRRRGASAGGCPWQQATPIGFPAAEYIRRSPPISLTGVGAPVRPRVDADTGAIVEYNPLHIVRLPEFDSDGQVGAIAVFDNAFITVHPGRGFVVYDCFVYWYQGGCWSYETKLAFGPLEERPELAGMFGKGAGDHVFLQGTVVALLQFWAAGNYYHTMMEAVVRLAIVHTYLIDNAAARVLVETNMPQVWHFVLDLLGVDRGRLIEYQSDKLHAVEHLLVPTVPDCFVAHGAAQRAMRTLLREGYRRLYPNAGRGPGVVVHARTDGARIVANHEELVAALKSEFGAEDIAEFRPGAAMPDAAGLHYAARVVVAPHGAGLANMLFMDAGTAIVELHPPHGNGWTNHGPHAVNECFAISAHRLGIRYRAIIGGGSGDTSFSVDAARVAEAVKEFLVS